MPGLRPRAVPAVKGRRLDERERAVPALGPLGSGELDEIAGAVDRGGRHRAAGVARGRRGGPGRTAGGDQGMKREGQRENVLHVRAVWDRNAKNAAPRRAACGRA